MMRGECRREQKQGNGIRQAIFRAKKNAAEEGTAAAVLAGARNKAQRMPPVSA